ncbi:HipA domain-containing protein [Subtercola sp. RTI3]|uniref:HipA domain-containing protein n=1 Tax=Subtercola sp. RTI3 TaxID=3048639 RepID=UPI002B22D538|nr:HipA domain-containing protein [Subtercola sp. RTI3]MEA9984388.1 HipA domain-containing protein [Subtercola sp. RTI3]
MSLLEARDGEQRSSVEIAELIEQFASLPTAQLAELWRRMVFSMLISTTDDHLRNHGSLPEDSSNSWNLAPAFDLNPNPEPGNKQLSTAVVDNDFDIDVESARAVAGLFRLSLAQAKTIEAEVRQSVARWAVEAARMQIRHSEIDLMAGRFEGA